MVLVLHEHGHIIILILHNDSNHSRGGQRQAGQVTGLSYQGVEGLLLPVQVGGGGDHSCDRVHVELVAGVGRQMVPGIFYALGGLKGQILICINI